MDCSSSSEDNEQYNRTLMEVQSLWQNCNMCPKIEMILENCFSSAENPYTAALYLMRNSDGFLSSKKTFIGFVVMKTFKKWLTDKENLSSSSLTREIKLDALSTVNIQKNLQLTKLVNEIYQLESDKELFLSNIKELISSQKFKQACQTAAILKLHSHFTIKDFLVQLILQDKLNVVDEFLIRSPEHQKNIVLFLDEVLGEDRIADKMECIVKELNVTEAKVYKFNHKCLSKLIGRYVNDFKISPEICPNYLHQQKKKALSFVIWKRYCDKTLEGESWNEMMLDIVKDSTKIQYDLIDILVDYHDVEEAFYWSKYFELDKDKIPHQVKCLYGDNTAKSTNEEDSWNNAEEESWDDDAVCSPLAVIQSRIPTNKKPRNFKGTASSHYHDTNDFDSDIWDMETPTGSASYNISQDIDVEDEGDDRRINSVKKLEVESDVLEEKPGEDVEENLPNDTIFEHHQLTLREDAIIIVDTAECFQDLIYVGLKDVEIMGLDCEWKPSFISKKNNVALMQVATWNRIYLIDVFTLSKDCSSLWSEFGRALFENEEIIKLGFDIHADKSMVKESIPSLRGFGSSSFLDLATLWKLLVNNYSFNFSFPNEKSRVSGQSLAQLVCLCFGKILDKSDQFSNWEKRPLRRSQKIYAALDAYCLLEIYGYLKNSCRMQDIPFEEVVSMALKKSKSVNATQGKSKKHRKRVDEVPSDNASPVVAESHYPPTFPNSMKMVCDTMVHGLGRKLRSCGINTWILLRNDPPDMCVKVAFRDQRIILTRGDNYHKFIKHVSPDQCYQVKSDLLDDQVKEVLSYFNVILREEDIFSRCQVCNGDFFAEIHNSLMQRIVVSFKDESSQNFAESRRCTRQDSYGSTETFSDYGKRWRSNCIRELKDVTDKTSRGVKIKFYAIPQPLLSQIEYFYVCEKCGKIYWDGGHWQRELSRKKEGNLLKQ